MRTYTLLNREFNDFDSFIAAKRDLEKIGSLDVTGTSAKDNADSVLRQIRERKLKFESEFGDEFLEDVRKNASEEELFFEARKQRESELERQRALDDRRRESRSKKGRSLIMVVRNTTLCFLGLMFISLAGLLVYNIRSEYRGRDIFESLREEKAESIIVEEALDLGAILPEYISMHAQNQDMVGWISIDLTPIDYPVMYKAGDNDYYLEHNFEGAYDANGMLVLDKRSDPYGTGNNMLVHGHNMKSGMMFGGLRKFADQGYAADHKIIHYDTLYEKRDYEIIAVFLTSVDGNSTDGFKYYDYININNEADFLSYIYGIKTKSLYTTDTTAHYGDRLLTLSTCDYSQKEGRLVVVAKQVDKQ